MFLSLSLLYQNKYIYCSIQMCMHFFLLLLKFILTIAKVLRLTPGFVIRDHSQRTQDKHLTRGRIDSESAMWKSHALLIVQLFRLLFIPIGFLVNRVEKITQKLQIYSFKKTLMKMNTVIYLLTASRKY